VPRYDYQCESCGSEFELTQAFSEAGSGICPTCSGSGRQRFHAVPVIYKGSGFYTTDYARAKPRTESSDTNNNKTKESDAGSVNTSKKTNGNESNAESVPKSESTVKPSDDAKG
jgi:putative FmdB family regulatory protein